MKVHVSEVDKYDSLRWYPHYATELPQSAFPEGPPKVTGECQTANITVTCDLVVEWKDRHSELVTPQPDYKTIQLQVKDAIISGTS